MPEEPSGTNVSRVCKGAEGLDPGIGSDDSLLAGAVRKRLLANYCFETSASTTLAQRPVLRHRHMPDLPRASAPTTQDTALGDEPRANTSADSEDEDILMPPGLAVQCFRNRKSIDIVLDEHRQVEFSTQYFAQPNMLPAKLRRIDCADGLIFHAAGHANTNTQQGHVSTPSDETVKQSCKTGCGRTRSRIKGLTD